MNQTPVNTAETSDTKIKPERVQDALEALPGWSLSEARNRLERVYSLPSYRSAVAFAAFVVEVAEVHRHHPTITIRGDLKVALRLGTAETSGLSEADLRLARAIDSID